VPSGGGSNGAGDRAASIVEETFAAFPFGIVVVDAGGVVQLHNSEAARLLDPAEDVDGNARCCDLFGCRRPGTSLEGSCLTELARSAGSVLPEVRIEQPDLGRSLWVTAAPLRADASLTVIQCRPGGARDRRRRTDPHWMRGPQLRIHTFGRTRIESSEGPIGGNWLERRPGQILKYLVTERHRVVHTEEIGEALWEAPDQRIAATVRYHVHVLRRQLEPRLAKRAQSSFILSRRGGYAVNLDRIWVDADAFEAKTREALRSYREGAPGFAEQLEGALSLYTGEFLADEPYSEWAMMDRDRLRGFASELLRALVDDGIAKGERHAAARFLEQLAELQPFDAAVHRELISLELELGRRSEARQHYSIFRTRLQREFGEEPDFTPASLGPGTA
jgi:DNA-binding SARP family transcriptional activator